MKGYVYLGTDWWVTTADYGQDARDLYLWAWSNRNVHGVTGIGRAGARLISAEVLLTPKRLERAWVVLMERGKVIRDGDWYFVIERPKHTCLREDGRPNPKMVASAYNHLKDRSIPEAIRTPFLELYGYLFDSLSKDHAPDTLSKEHSPLAPVNRKPQSVSSSKVLSRSAGGSKGGTKEAVSGRLAAEQKTERQRIARLFRQGFPTGCVPATSQDRSGIVDILEASADYDREVLVRALCLDALKLKKRMGWLVSVLAGNKYQPTDESTAQAKKEVADD